MIKTGECSEIKAQSTMRKITNLKYRTLRASQISKLLGHNFLEKYYENIIKTLLGFAKLFLSDVN